MSFNIALVNTNRIKPPIAPIGLDYVAEAINAVGHLVEVLDLCWEDDCEAAITNFFNHRDFALVGITLRNTDDCAFTSRQSFLEDFAQIVNTIRKNTDAMIVLGGVGFSVMPEYVLPLCQADAGIWGDGESALVGLAAKLEGGNDWSDTPNLIYNRDGALFRNPPADLPLESLPHMSRAWVDNRRYFLEGGQAGIETKRGCPNLCIYCADPVAKGKRTRIRPARSVADELESLLKQNIDHIHTCDSEFNLPEHHAKAVCLEVIQRGIADRLCWYAYCAPVPFSAELANLMKKAGCAGINFGVDSGDRGMLRRLKRDFKPDDILKTVRICKDAGMSVMLDLLVGAPGETRESIMNTIEMVKRAEADRIGIATGVRVYPGTELGNNLNQEKHENQYNGCINGKSPSDPLFFLEPEVTPFVFGLLDELIGDDRRFFFFDPSKPERNYNYNANQLLVDAIKKGYRGAYWDILRRYEAPSIHFS